MRAAFFWDITQRVVAIPYRRFEITYWSHFKGKKYKNILEFSTSTNWLSETSVKNYNYKLRSNPEERSSQTQTDKETKSTL
jgi:hypothetical protein